MANSSIKSLNEIYNDLSSTDSALYKILYPYQFGISFDFPSASDLFKQENEIQTPAKLNEALRTLVQNTTPPGLFIGSLTSLESPNSEASLEMGRFQVPSKGSILPGSPQFSFQIICTEDNLLEKFFLDWLKEVSANKYLYADKPFTRANITIDFFRSNLKDIAFSYIFRNCFPLTFDFLAASHTDTSIKIRELTLYFDWVYPEKGKKQVGENLMELKELPQEGQPIYNKEPSVLQLLREINPRFEPTLRSFADVDSKAELNTTEMLNNLDSLKPVNVKPIIKEEPKEEDLFTKATNALRKTARVVGKVADVAGAADTLAKVIKR